MYDKYSLSPYPIYSALFGLSTSKWGDILELSRCDLYPDYSRDERLKAEEESRKAAGMTTYADDWKEARRNLQILKIQGTRVVKANSTLKPLWNAGRRAITVKIGQLTNDEPTINRVSSQLIEILLPPLAPIPLPVYIALLSSLAKAFVLQAETEISAAKRSAIPLAQVTFNCLERLEGFSEVLYAKMTQRIGPWLVPCPIPEKDFDDRAWKDVAEMRLMLGLRTGEDGAMETQSQYMDRVKGVARLYFEVLKIVPRQGPMKRMFQLPRYWSWMARMLGRGRCWRRRWGQRCFSLARFFRVSCA
ncbi:GLE1-like protein-domain-containing protein [Rhodocollybia butyracea]|uniref:mRNA export factor GLE1 n=1 Tax=Rhodocollybia butyracea TaxID=206335 RepID=A0A9P5PFM6_9AGAR|nr:GLE1-like protein-domain-containing protein [Rhodocollybia butyracea]